MIAWRRACRSLLILACGLGLLLALTSCSRVPEGALRIGTNVWIGSEPLYLARELGRLDPATVELVEYPSASEVLRAYRNEAIDGMVISLDELFGLAVDGHQPRIVLVVDVSHGADVVVGRRGMRTMKDLKGKSIAVESSALGAFVLSRALALNGMQASDVKVVHLESNEQPGAFEKGEVDAAVTFDPYRAQFLRAGGKTLFDSTQMPGEIVDLLAVRASVIDKKPNAVRALLAGWFGALDYMNTDPKDAARRMGIRQQTTGEQFLEALRRSAHPVARREPADAGRQRAGAGGHRSPADGVDGRGEAPQVRPRDREGSRPGAARGILEMSPLLNLRIPATLKLTVPLILLGFAATLSAVNLLYHVPEAERAAEEDGRKRLTEEMSRLQSTLEYLLLKGDDTSAQHEIAVLAHNHDVLLAVLTDDRDAVIASTRRAWLGRPIADVFPQLVPEPVATAKRESRTGITIVSTGGELLGRAEVLVGGGHAELRPTRTGNVFLAYDLKRYKAEARAQVVQQSLYWAGWVTVLALAMWLCFHFLLSRRTARLVHAAEELAAGNLAARSNLKGTDELGRLGRSFDAMALEVADTQTRLRHDIEARVRVQRELEASEASYRSIFDAAEDSIFVHDPMTGAILDVNPKACATFGYTREEFRKIDIGQLGTGERPYTKEDGMALIARAYAGEPLRIEWPGRSKDGTVRWHEVFVKRASIGGHDRILALARDIDDKKRSAEELARQRESLYQREKLAALGSLLAGVAHELNNPLSVVVARAVLLEERGNPGTQVAAQKIRTAAERCARIVRTFLAMARQQQPERGPVAVNDVVAAAIDITGYAVRTSGIDVTLHLAEDIPPILADADQLHQVLLNLIINAQQSLQDRPRPRRIGVTSRYDPRDDVVRLTVADNGPGIPPAVRARIFEPYFTTKPVGVGLGVGLAVSLGIVEAHGGTLAVECPEAGGAVFTITLPVGAVAPVATGAAPAWKAGATGRTILVVDDEAEIRETLTEILTAAWHRVVAVGSGREALERMAVEHYDVILTDIRMPDLDGRALYQEIEQRWPGAGLRVVFITGDTLASALREFVSKSGRPVIEKPFLPGEVRRVVAEVATAGAVAPPD